MRRLHENLWLRGATIMIGALSGIALIAGLATKVFIGPVIGVVIAGAWTTLLTVKAERATQKPALRSILTHGLSQELEEAYRNLKSNARGSENSQVQALERKAERLTEEAINMLLELDQKLRSITSIKGAQENRMYHDIKKVCSTLDQVTEEIRHLKAEEGGSGRTNSEKVARLRAELEAELEETHSLRVERKEIRKQIDPLA